MTKMKKATKLLMTLILTCGAFFATAVATNAASYNYDYWKNPVPSAEGLSYKDTYYGKDILNVDGSGTSLTFNTLEDMEVFNGQIFVLDSKNESAAKKKYIINNIEVELQGVSTIYLLNDEMKYVQEPIFEFEATKSVCEKLAAYYLFDTPLAEITKEQITSNDLTVKAPYIPLMKESVLMGTDEYSGASLLLSNAQGIAVVSEGNDFNIYVADSDNSRILKMNSDYVVTEVFLTPDDETFFQFNGDIPLAESTDTVFTPLKIVVDRTKRVYCIAKSVYEGIIEFGPRGDFNRFLGKNVVTANPLKVFWTKIMSKVQKDAIALDLPPEFINIAIDQDGFLYTTSYPDADDPKAADMIKAINTAGKDVLRRNGYVEPVGDNTYLIASTNKDAVLGASTLSAIAVNPNGIYSVTDAKRGRIFTYDTEGNLLYISGEKGSLSNSINNPVAIKYLTVPQKGEGTYEQELVLVLDKTSKSIISFSTSTFGQFVNKATELYLANDIVGAEEYWREVIKMNSNYELGYVGIGKSLLRAGEYEEAMGYFKLGHNSAYYSKAYQQYRDNILKDNFALLMTGIIVIVVGYAAIKVLKYQHKRKLNMIYNSEEGNREE